jgi:hypothetical protein
MRFHFNAMLAYVSRYQDAMEVKRLTFKRFKENNLAGFAPSFKSRSTDQIKKSRLKHLENKNRQ